MARVQDHRIRTWPTEHGALQRHGTGAACGRISNDHGTHVAGAIAGTGATGTLDGNGFLRGQGVAPGASLVNQAVRSTSEASPDPAAWWPDGMLQHFQGFSRTAALYSPTIPGDRPTTPQGYDIPTMEIDFISRDAHAR
ncbi:MAG: S8 family serine peptidase [Xanthomonadales bacterium]|nr:S8 family serine peptidase [Xanthomonadales bacterium]